MCRGLHSLNASSSCSPVEDRLTDAPGAAGAASVKLPLLHTCRMTFSQALYDWGVAYVARLHPDGLNVRVDPPTPWEIPGARVLVESASAGCELIVWDSGQVEYIRGPNGAFLNGTIEESSQIGSSQELQALFTRFDDDLRTQGVIRSSAG